MNVPGSLFLVGPMGAGKSTIGRQLSKQLKRPFLDSDHEIEARIDRIGSSSIRSVYVVRNDAGEDLARATFIAVCIDPETRRPTA